MIGWENRLNPIVLAQPHGEDRLKIVREAWGWQDTPWRHHSRDKGKAVDCGNFPAAVFHNAGLIAQPVMIDYPADFFHHSKEEIFRDQLEQFCNRMGKITPSAGDILGFQLNPTTPSVCHVGIFVEGTRMIHVRGGIASRGGTGNQGHVEFGDLLGEYLTMFSGVWRLKAWCD